jgi:hypothetical protein
VRSSNDGETISEREKRERGALQADVMELERDAAGMKKLRGWARDAASGDDDRREEIATAVESEPAGALRRLLYSGPEVSSVTVEADPHTTQDLASVRGMLDAALERSVFGRRHVSRIASSGRSATCARSRSAGCGWGTCAMWTIAGQRPTR